MEHIYLRIRHIYIDIINQIKMFHGLDVLAILNDMRMLAASCKLFKL